MNKDLQRSRRFRLAGLTCFGLAMGCGGGRPVTPARLHLDDATSFTAKDEARAYAQTVRFKLDDAGEAIIRQLSFDVITDERGRTTCSIAGPADMTLRNKITDCLQTVYPSLSVQWQ